MKFSNLIEPNMASKKYYYIILDYRKGQMNKFKIGGRKIGLDNEIATLV